MIGIIDYGLGNIKAFYNLYREINIDLKIIDNYKNITKDVKKLILPGVGSFDEAIKKLKNQNFFDEIKDFCTKEDNKILGICVGMQILGKNSQEGKEQGLNLIDGKVLRFKSGILPQMGWNNVSIKNKDLILNNISNDDYFYFLHSYYFQEEMKENVLGISNYDHSFTSIIKKNNIYGVQFHPEKSHKPGIELLKNFSDI